MQRGEWWIEDSGFCMFADGDVGDANHEMLAFYSALGVDSENSVVPLTREVAQEYERARGHRFDPEEWGFEEGVDEIEVVIECCGIGHVQAAALLEAGSSPDAVAWFLNDKQGDARNYAVEHMAWIRVKGPNAEMWEFNDDALKRLQNADFWDEEDEDDEAHEFTIEEDGPNRTYWSVPFKVLLKAQNAAQVKAYVAGYRSGFDGTRTVWKPWWLGGCGR